MVGTGVLCKGGGAVGGDCGAVMGEGDGAVKGGWYCLGVLFITGSDIITPLPG